MASGGDADKSGEEARRLYGSRALAALVPPLLRPAFRRRAPATAQVLADWEAIVGPQLAASTTPLRLSSGTLTIRCAGAVALELQHLAEELRARINGHLGQVAVLRLRFMQAAPARPPQPSPARPQAIAAAGRAVAGLPAGELRDALERLGRAVLTDRPPDGTATDEPCP